MKRVKRWYFKQIAVAVIFGLLIIGSVPAQSLAYMVDSSVVTAPASRAADMDNIQRVLESKLVSQKLSQAGLSMTEIKSRLDRLSDSDLHQFAKQIDSVYPGGDALGVIIAILVIVLLVLLILKIQNKKIVIQ